MPICVHCHATLPRGAGYCGNCGATVNQPTTLSLNQGDSQKVSPLSNSPSIDKMSMRLEKAMRRQELLSYAVAGIGATILFVMILIAFL
jgi:predicted amidophosphoribosyltransferase